MKLKTPRSRTPKLYPGEVAVYIPDGRICGVVRTVHTWIHAKVGADGPYINDRTSKFRKATADEENYFNGTEGPKRGRPTKEKE